VAVVHGAEELDAAGVHLMQRCLDAGALQEHLPERLVEALLRGLSISP